MYFKLYQLTMLKKDRQTTKSITFDKKILKLQLKKIIGAVAINQLGCEQLGTTFKYLHNLNFIFFH
jgi:hypothetical protein